MGHMRLPLLTLLALAGIAGLGLLAAAWSGTQASQDSDGDGYDDALEAYLSTDLLSDCPTTSGTDAWPPDVDQDGWVGVLDMIQLTPPVFGSREGDPLFTRRYDLNADGMIGVLDLAQLDLPLDSNTCPGQFVPVAGGAISEIAIDMHTAGNDLYLTQGADVQKCGGIDSGGTNTIDIDLIVPDASAYMKAWELLLNYDPAVVAVTGETHPQLLGGNAPSDQLPDTSGSWRACDGGTPDAGPGVLKRITLTGVGPGTSPLTLTKAGAMNGSLGPIEVISVSEAKVIVDPVWPVPPGDGDCDGFTDDEEAFVATDAVDDCPDNVDDDAWPADMASLEGYGKHDGKVNVLDIVQLTPPAFGDCTGDPNYAQRKDFDASGCINILDIVRLTPPMFGKSCTP